MHPIDARGWLLAAGLGLAAAILGGCGGSAPTEASAPAPGDREQGQADAPDDRIAIRVAPVRREAIASLYATSTTLRADRQATVIARTQGVIRSLDVEEGDWVDAGRVVAVLEDDEQRIEFERAKSAFDVEEREFRRAERLHGEDLLSSEAFEAARREYEDARHGLARARLDLERTAIQAPFAGRILIRHLDVGATVADGTAVYDLADLSPLYADVSVPERHVAQLSRGQSVRLAADADRRQIAARIERIAPSVDVATGTVKVTLAVEGATGLRPGTFVRVEIVTDTHPDALIVPRSSLVADGRRWHLFRLEEGGETVEQVEVRLGYEEGDRVEIAARGDGGQPLAVGDRVVVLGAPALSAGARVRVVEDGGEDLDDAPA